MGDVCFFDRSSFCPTSCNCPSYGKNESRFGDFFHAMWRDVRTEEFDSPSGEYRFSLEFILAFQEDVETIVPLAWHGVRVRWDVSVCWIVNQVTIQTQPMTMEESQLEIARPLSASFPTRTPLSLKESHRLLPRGWSLSRANRSRPLPRWPWSLPATPHHCPRQ